MTRYVVVTGTNTDVGKTIATAALAVRWAREGSVIVVKPVQTGIPLEPTPGTPPGDADVVARLAEVDVRTFTVLADPLAPDTAARRAGVSIPAVADYLAPLLDLGTAYDTVIVEGAGGLLVRLDTEGGTLLDLAALLPAAEVVVVCAAGLGTLNHTELTVGALRDRGLEPAGLVIGSWPTDPGLAERCNRDDLPLVTGVAVSAVLPAGAGSLEPPAFRAAAPGWFA